MDAIKEVVQQKYGEAALQARSGAKAGCGCGTVVRTGPDHLESLRRHAGRERARRSAAGLAGLRQPDGTGGAESR